MSHQPLTFAILGAGGRGLGFARFIVKSPELGRVVAVAEPDPERRKVVADLCEIPMEMQFERWEDLLARPKLADVVLNTLMDRLHRASAVQAMKLGYDMMLEKPMATTLEDCVAIDRAQQETNRIVAVCHSLRYHRLYREIKRLLTEGAIGDLVTFDQLEAVEHVHQSHSFVRGNWGNEGRSTFMLMAKSCHDVDILAWLVDKSCRRVSSFGSLNYFRKENAPAGAPERCTDGCPAELTCPYLATKVYVPDDGWVWHTEMANKTQAERLEMLKTSRFGRCVFHADNDVVDHQVVSFEFEGGVTGTFTMTAFTLHGGRHIRLHGTKGLIIGHTEKNIIELHRFADGTVNEIKVGTQKGGHGGGDSNVIRELVHAIRTRDPQAVPTSTAVSLATHKIVFAAERARRERRVVELAEIQ